MTRRDYIALAAALRADAAHLSELGLPRAEYSDLSEWERGAYDQWNTAVLAIAAVLAADNPRFDRGRFLTAAGFSA